MLKSNRVARLAVFLLAAVGASTAFAAEETASNSSPANFKGKVVMLMVDYSSALEDKRSTEYISDAAVEEIGGRYFVTGKAYSMKEPPKDSPPDWRKGAYIGIAWDKVQQFYVFTPDQIEEMLKRRMNDGDDAEE
jgi:hypothetical protein